MNGLLDQLMHLKAMTIRTGAIHEAQVLQLRNYPLLIPGIKQSIARVDVERKMVEYKITKAEPGQLRIKSGQFSQDTANLTKCVQTLLWPDAVVVLKKDGKVLYDSRN